MSSRLWSAGKSALWSGFSAAGAIIYPSSGAFVTPASLFVGGVPGGFWDMQDLASMRQGDTSGTAAAAAGSPVGYITDKSPNGNHETQADATRRPVLNQDNGVRYTTSDNVNDFLRATFAFNQAWTRITALRGLAAGGQLLGGVTSNHGLIYSGGSLQLWDGVSGAAGVAAAALTQYVVTEIRNGTAGQLGIEKNARVNGVIAAGNPGGLTIHGDNAGASSPSNVTGVVMIGRILTAQEISDTITWFAAQQGRVL